MTSHVENQIQARIAKARQQKEARRQQRAEFDEQRQHGLQARHTAKIRRWGDAAYTYSSDEASSTGTCDQCGTPDLPLHRAVWGNPSDGTAGDGSICSSCKDGNP